MSKETRIKLEKLIEHYGSREAVAVKISYSAPSVSNWLRGTRITRRAKMAIDRAYAFMPKGEIKC